MPSQMSEYAHKVDSWRLTVKVAVVLDALPVKLKAVIGFTSSVRKAVAKIFERCMRNSKAEMFPSRRGT